jgi:hypothetical protein
MVWSDRGSAVTDGPPIRGIPITIPTVMTTAMIPLRVNTEDAVSKGWSVDKIAIPTRATDP